MANGTFLLGFVDFHPRVCLVFQCKFFFLSGLWLQLVSIASFNSQVHFIVVVAEADGALDKARKHKKRQLEDTLTLVLKKRKVCLFMFAHVSSNL